MTSVIEAGVALVGCFNTAAQIFPMLPEKLSTDLRTAMEDEADQSEIDSLVSEIKSDLDQAEQELS